ncbi:hypothetical protein SMI01S_16120 [Sphingobacterium mizutaii NBRC 14946 = DSM 11724]|uniref:Domain of uncharacterized function (DUF892) n=2 Tax=Sphingobacterium mizutaii TaxID=1010 RepID=A0AAJ5BYU2_9SPHI|nr:DUF892 family protein [Sphingobacterium mizutaii]GEM68006.1 hypothetical protein SMI01S_16120 [Sphingobacterium mizutaii NBRC 14946 = DSM 11724]SDL78654.1 Ferritin-like metal-binding protein YciE [Sphingobacterium mizutaii]SNV37646.1 Domain of uncharacterised function (DUF892) [Sphingobacterium mizutaii]
MAKKELNKEGQNTGTQGTDQINETDKKAEQSPQKGSQLYVFFLSGLKDVLYAENKLVEALLEMESAASSEELKDAFEDHHLLTKKHVSRLNKIFGLLGEKAEAKECKAIEGILEEAREIIKNTPEGSATRDVGLIIAAQKVEHYEIATYGGLAQLAITLGFDKIADLLERTLEEEEETDRDLTFIAENHINPEAEQED